jgi:exodeoxyribonuclease-5
VELSKEQTTTMKDIFAWLKNWKSGGKGSRFTDVYVLAGWAGTGKTTLVTEMLKSMPQEALLDTAMVTYTGKASDVLAQKLSDSGARPGYVGTIHSLFYVPSGEDNTTGDITFDLKQSKRFVDTDGIKLPFMSRDGNWYTVNIKFLIVDELSMIHDEMFRDLTHFDIPILFCGDHYQVPPVNGGTHPRLLQANTELITVHRQALDNPIIKAATFVRTGKNLGFGQLDKSLIRFRPTKTELNALLGRFIDKYFRKEEGTGVILCGKNKTRHFYNKKARDQLGFKGTMPKEGELVVCLKNDRETGLKNGTLCKVLTPCVLDGDSKKETRYSRGKMQVLPVHGGNPIKVKCHTSCFGSDLSKMDMNIFKDRQFFDFGYALTVHKAQGSEWDAVFLINQRLYGQSEEEYTRWFYTGVTRASKTLLIAG